jgi:flagellar basal body-associated protein FliL
MLIAAIAILYIILGLGLAAAVVAGYFYWLSANGKNPFQ